MDCGLDIEEKEELFRKMATKGYDCNYIWGEEREVASQNFSEQQWLHCRQWRRFPMSTGTRPTGQESTHGKHIELEGLGKTHLVDLNDGEQIETTKGSGRG